jgi:hypothetical protein
MFMSRLALISISVAVALAVLVVSIALAVKSGLFPYHWFFDVQKISPRTYVQSSDADGNAAHLRSIGVAQARVARYVGPLRSDPVWIICNSSECYSGITGNGFKASAFGSFLIVVSPRAHSVEFLAHELLHAELSSRLSSSAIKQVPAWFNEGLAVLVSEDPRFTSRTQSWQRLNCIEEYDEFFSQIAKDYETAYSMALSCVAPWFGKAGEGGFSKIIDLLNSGAKRFEIFEPIRSNAIANFGNLPQ